MPIDFAKLISWSYLTARFPGPLNRSFYIAWLLVSVAAIVVAVVGRTVLAKRGLPPAWLRVWRSVASAVTVSASVSLLLLFFRAQRTPFLSMRLFVLVLIVGAIAWVATLVVLGLRQAPAQVRAWEEQQRLAKYLPRAK